MDYSTGTLNTMCSPFFPDLRADLGPYLVDKTKLIENIVVNNRLKGHVDLVLRPRRSGKSTMLQMLKSFFSIPQNRDPDPHLLFDGLDITFRQDICTEHMGKYPVIFCDFKNLYGKVWEEMLSDFKYMVSDLYMEWEDCLMQSLEPVDKTYFESICLMTATKAEWGKCLYRLSQFLAQKFGRKVIVLIDEYEVPNHYAYEHGYFKEANEFFGRGVLPVVLKSNEYLQYAVLAGITPAAKSGWYSAVTNLEVHALHTNRSIFTGMLMFTEREVNRLKTFSNSKLKLDDLKAHYNSYIAASSAGHISVYNPVSVMSAFSASNIENFWVATGMFPLSNSEVLDDGLSVAENLLARNEIDFELTESVPYSNLTLSQDETLSLLYYAGYLTMTVNGHFKIPNLEVMTDWARWVIGGVAIFPNHILEICVEGPVSDFEADWPNFMQQVLHRRLVAKDRGADSRKTPQNIFRRVFFLGLMQSLGAKGWKVSVESRAGGSDVNFRLLHKRKRKAVLIALKSSEKEGDMERDANRALEQLAIKYRNLVEGLSNISSLREYGIVDCHFNSYVKGRYLEFNTNTQNQWWVEKDDPAISVW